MSLLNFDKPAKRRSTKEHNAKFSSDSGISFVPNMSDEDNERWKAVSFNVGRPDARVELRKYLGGANVLIIVALNGWNYKNESRGDSKWGDTLGLNVRFSVNGPIKATFAEFTEINAIIEEAKFYLQDAENSYESN